MEHTAFAHLPKAVFALAPELRERTWPVEERATCSQCAVGAPPEDTDRLRPLNIDVKCCTYHPTHPNWLVGRALRREGAGAEQVNKRLLCMDDGISVVGIGPGSDLKSAWLSFKDPWTMFGQLPEYLCPYFDRQTTGCTVWQDRGAICRTWFCKHSDGTRGYELWAFTRRTLKSIERRLAAWCIVHGDPPDEADWGNREVMTAWFIRCADLVDGMSDEDAASLRDELLEKRIAELQRALDQHAPPLPEFIGPSVGWFERQEDGSVLACAQSGLDTIQLPSEIFQLWSRLDGKTPWQDALAAANEAIGSPTFDRALLVHLFRMGLLEERDPRAKAPPPGASMTASSRLLPHDAEDKLW